jgi:hypothetical protein
MRVLAIFLLLIFVVGCASTKQHRESYAVITSENFKQSKISDASSSLVELDSVAATSKQGSR